MRAVAVLTAALGFLTGTAWAGECAGLPPLAVKTPPGYCVGVVASGLKMPRGLAFLPDGRLLVTEMGSWVADRGRLTVLTRDANGWQAKQVLTGLDRPHGIVAGPDGRLYLGEAGRIRRFTLASLDGGAPQLEDAITLPPPGDRRHPLVNMAFAEDGSLYVNVGSATDNCESAPEATRAAGRCPETEGKDAVGLVRRYRVDKQGNISGGEVFATGMRNSMALAIHPSGTVLEGENSRDAIHKPLGLPNDEELPHDELNVLQSGKHYGWPFCYDQQVAAPEFPKYACARTEAPTRLLPAHVAPLGMAWWLGDKAPAAYRGWLVVGFHGYRKYGHRLMAFPVDAKGVPKGQPVELIHDWQDARGVGAPVDVRPGPDGALYLTDDKHGQVLVLSKERT